MPHMPHIQLRREQPADHDAVRAVHLAAFGDDGQTIADLVSDLRRSVTTDRGLSLIAEHDGATVGHVMFTASLLDAPRRLVCVQVLSPLGVLPTWQGRGVGSALVREGLRLITAQSPPVVFVEGDPRYYVRFGFVPGHTLGYRRPSLRTPKPAFQALNLPSHEPWMTGTLVYSQTFWDHDAVGLRDTPP